MPKCEPDCTCKRHRKALSEQARQNIARANAARKGESHKCPEGCTCARHHAYYRGGSKKGRTLSDQARSNMTQAARKRAQDPIRHQQLVDQISAQRADPEFEAKRVAALREALRGTSCPEGCECAKHSEEARRKISESRKDFVFTDEHKRKISDAARAAWASRTPEEIVAIMAKRSVKLKEGWVKEKAEGRVRQTGGYLHSKHELALVPYLAALGYEHNAMGQFWIGRRVPDFVDHVGKRVHEYFGAYWHPRPEEEAEIIDYYHLLGWKCTVLWEQDLYSFLVAHKELVTGEEHELAWRVARVNNGYRKPPDLTG